ncbi:unnamed protein product [Microthlaspi erraticum]|uniref:Enolase C-terminal TIM barrel domain-containing protein n=1 Tax=Microthlaspi erraticum TaxID=1685480 RepID=A0A6D2INH7_9BRAS|nr:unnamed protein product [Microthlaspi erraticum]
MWKRVGWGVMANHTSGETEDTFIAVDLSTISFEPFKNLDNLRPELHADLSVLPSTTSFCIWRPFTLDSTSANLWSLTRSMSSSSLSREFEFCSLK